MPFLRGNLCSLVFLLRLQYAWGSPVFFPGVSFRDGGWADSRDAGPVEGLMSPRSSAWFLSGSGGCQVSSLESGLRRQAAPSLLPGGT